MGPIDCTRLESRARRENAREVYCVPRSLWITTRSASRFSIAIPSALTSKLAICDESIDQPTTRFERASSTTAKLTLPFCLGCSVRSVSHNRLGSVRAKSRITRLDVGGMFGIFRYFGYPGKPARLRQPSKGSTAQRATVMFRQSASSA